MSAGGMKGNNAIVSVVGFYAAELGETTAELERARFDRVQLERKLDGIEKLEAVLREHYAGNGEPGESGCSKAARLLLMFATVGKQSVVGEVRPAPEGEAVSKPRRRDKAEKP